MIKFNKKLYFLGIFFIVLITIIYLFLLRQKNPERVLEELSFCWKEEQAYKLEDRIIKKIKRTRSIKKRASLNLLLGRLRFLKALNSPDILKKVHLNLALQALLESRKDESFIASSDFWTGVCLYTLGTEYYGSAIDYLISSLREGYPDRLKVIKILNYIYLKNNQFDIIIKINEEFLKNRFMDLDVIYSLGRAWREKGNYKEALEVLKKAEEIPSESFVSTLIRFETAESLFGLGEYEKAASLYSSFLKECAQYKETEEWKNRARENLLVCLKKIKNINTDNFTELTNYH